MAPETCEWVGGPRCRAGPRVSCQPQVRETPRPAPIQGPPTPAPARPVCVASRPNTPPESAGRPPRAAVRPGVRVQAAPGRLSSKSGRITQKNTFAKVVPNNVPRNYKKEGGEKEEGRTSKGVWKAPLKTLAHIYTSKASMYPRREHRQQASGSEGGRSPG